MYKHLYCSNIFFIFKDNKVQCRKIVEKTIEKGLETAVEIVYQTIRIPIKIGAKIVWKCIKLPVKLGWKMIKIPSKIVLRLALRLAKVPLKKITPQYLQNQIKDLIRKYEFKKNHSRLSSKYHNQKTRNGFQNTPPIEKIT